MDKDFLKVLERLKLVDRGVERPEDNSYVIDLQDSEEYAKIFTRLEKDDQLELQDSNQVVTEKGSSLMYSSDDEGLLVNLTADWEGDVYTLVLTDIKGR